MAVVKADIIYELIYFTLCAVPWAAIHTRFFREKMRIPVYSVALIVAGLWVICCLQYWLLRSNDVISVNALSFVMLVPMIITTMLFTGESVYKQLFEACSLALYVGFISAAGGFIACFFPAFPKYAVTDIAMAAVFLATLNLMFINFRHLAASTLSSADTHIWRKLAALSGCLVITAFLGGSGTDKPSYLRVMAIRGAALACVHVTAMFAVSVQKKLLQKTTEKEKPAETPGAPSNEALAAMHPAYRPSSRALPSLDDWGDCIIKTDNISEHIDRLQDFIDMSDMAGLQEYIYRCRATTPVPGDSWFCPNTLLNSLLRYFELACDGFGIQSDIQANFPEQTGFARDDMTLLFGSIMQNALDACRRMPAGSKRWVRVRIMPAMGKYAVCVSNSYDGNIFKSDDGRLLTTKHTNIAGTGLEAVRMVTERYRGLLLIEPEAELFKISFTLTPPGATAYQPWGEATS